MSDWASVWIQQVTIWKIHSERVGTLTMFLLCDCCFLWSAVNKTLRCPQRVFCVISPALCRCHLLPKPNRECPINENVSDRDSLLLCATCVKRQLRKMSGPDSADMSGVYMRKQLMFAKCWKTQMTFTWKLGDSHDYYWLYLCFCFCRNSTAIDMGGSSWNNSGYCTSLRGCYHLVSILNQ